MSDPSLLVIELADYQHLANVFGEDAARRAVGDLEQAVGGLIDRLLAAHEILTRDNDRQKHRWSASFRINDRLRNREETLDAVENAGRSLLREAVNSIFGTGTGMRTPVRLLLLRSNASPDALDNLLAATHQADETAHSADEIEDILRTGKIRTVLQPIVRLSDRQVIGYEALSRGPAGSPLERPDIFFAAANAAGLGMEAELTCARLALERTSHRLPAGSFLSINLGPEAIALASEALPLRGHQDLVIELTEHLPLDAAEQLQSAVTQLRRLGSRMALDDTGCGFADLETAKILRPDIVKLCITIIRNAQLGNPYIEAIRQTVSELHALRIQVLAEGVETESQHTALSDCRIELGQGWLYGRPVPIDDTHSKN